MLHGDLGGIFHLLRRAPQGLRQGGRPVTGVQGRLRQSLALEGGTPAGVQNRRINGLEAASGYLPVQVNGANFTAMLTAIR